VTQHATLTPERWTTFSLDQQILMIANEMNRASKLFGAEDRDLLKGCYERVLRLTDLTIEARGLEPALLLCAPRGEDFVGVEPCAGGISARPASCASARPSSSTPRHSA